ncbi:MAG: large-conductance mechanosensitive channel protein MscL [Ruminococcaceae bacterium]|nr:large-conductance mechanosensitive channel protein MscL [Oscillospiraceae bacterium]MBR3596891.1 large-conductance mechanosensitive channel protein MscL [Clostridia bacterium]
MKKFLSDFKAFALKGNIVDMAVGVVVGGAFGKIVTSLVNDIITPLIGLLTGNISLVDLKIVLAEAVIEAGEVVTPELAITYGAFLQTIIDFIIIALSIFLVLRIAMNARKKFEDMKKKEEEIKEEAAEEVKETELSVLLEIRELLKKE